MNSQGESDASYDDIIMQLEGEGDLSKSHLQDGNNLDTSTKTMFKPNGISGQYCYLPNSGTSLFCTMYCLTGLLPSNPGVQLTFTALCPPSSVLQFPKS